MDEFVDIARALSDPSRVRILCALKNTELCVCQIVELLGLATSTVSKHISVLRQARLVDSRKTGRWVYYRRADERSSPLSMNAIAWCDASLVDDATMQDDALRLKKILKTPLIKLCCS